MSVLDELRQAHERAMSRLEELRPLVDEYQALLQEVERLRPTSQGAATPEVAPAVQLEQPPSGAEAPAAATRRPSRARRTTAGKRGSSTRPASARVSKASPAKPPRTSRNGSAATGRPRPGTRNSGGRRADLLRLVEQTPGITLREVGRELGVDPTGLYRVARGLERDGAVRRRDGKLELTGETS